MIFRFRFTARRRGAIGLSEVFERERVGETEEEARLKLYDEFEHVHLPVLLSRRPAEWPVNV